MTDLDLTMIKANLASLNEIVAEMADAMELGITPDARWVEVVRNTCREHNWSLGFDWHGQREPDRMPPRE